MPSYLETFRDNLSGPIIKGEAVKEECVVCKKICRFVSVPYSLFLIGKKIQRRKFFVTYKSFIYIYICIFIFIYINDLHIYAQRVFLVLSM